MTFLAGAGMVLFSCVSVGQRGQLAAQSYPVTMDYGASVEDLLHAGGYDRIYSEINSSNFQGSGTGSRELVVTLVRLDTQTPLSKVIAAEEKKGLRAATVTELLAFGRTYPDLQRKITIAGLGSQKTYLTITWERFGMGPNDVDEVRTYEPYYPCLITDFFGRAVVLIQESMIPAYNPGGFYGCFVAEASPGGS